MEAVGRGELPAFERLYSLYEKRVFQYVCTLVYDSSLAKEIVGETMLAVWRGAETFAFNSRVSTWIFGIARHKALDAIRRVSRYRKREVELDEVSDMPNPSDHPDERIIREQTATLTRKAIAALSPEHREALRLAFYEELPYKEIATLLSIPENTVKTRVYYAKQKLKEQLERLGYKESI